MSIDTQCDPNLLFAAALRGDEVELLDERARTRPLAAWRWHTTTVSDRSLLAACQGPTLDVGCGPGRMTAELTETGGVSLGIDVVPEAVEQTRARGGHALLRDVYDEVPGEGRWQTVLLADGNIGIGGDPLRLLRRASDLLVPGGRVVVDLAAPGFAGSVRTHRLAHGELLSQPFRWAVVGIDEIAALGRRAGLLLHGVEQCPGVEGAARWFAVLRRPRA